MRASSSAAMAARVRVTGKNAISTLRCAMMNGENDTCVVKQSWGCLCGCLVELLIGGIRCKIQLCCTPTMVARRSLCLVCVCMVGGNTRGKTQFKHYESTGDRSFSATHKEVYRALCCFSCNAISRLKFMKSFECFPLKRIKHPKVNLQSTMPITSNHHDTTHVL